MDKKPFNSSNQRYVTAGINDKLPLLYQIKIWDYIEEASKEVPLDYLQTFELRTSSDKQGNIVQIIIHRQEQPSYIKEYTTEIIEGKPINEKVFVIDDGDYCTMLFASEY